LTKTQDVVSQYTKKHYIFLS